MPDMAYGDGTITRRADGRLAVRVTVAGKRRTVMIRAMPDAKAQLRLAKAEQKRLQEQRDAGIDPSGQTVAVYLRSWLESIADARRSRIRPRTFDHYQLIVERHIIPTLGKHRLDRLNERHVQAWLDADAGSARTIHHHRAVLRRALNVAMRQRLIGRNPAIAVELPRVADFAGAPLTLEEGRALFAASADDRLGPLWRLAINTGLRVGELLGLARDDVDTDARLVTVTSQLQRRAGQWVRVAPKAGRKLESIAIGPRTATVIRGHLIRQAAERRPDWKYWGLLFVTADGQPYHEAAVLRAFHLACDRAGIPRRRFHDLRGSSSTLMAEEGIAEDVRMARQGHATVAMARKYAQARGPLDRDAADRLDAALG